MSLGARISLLHATAVAMEPIAQAMRDLWPEAEAINLLDDGLTIDRARDGECLSEELTERFVSFGIYAASLRAAGLLITCSAFGPAIDRLVTRVPIPVLRPNEAMFREAIAAGRHVTMIATFAPAVSTMEAEFNAFTRESGQPATLTTTVVAEAMTRLRAGDVEAHNSLVAAAAAALPACDALMLAHFSTSRAAAAVRAVTAVPVFTAPEAAVTRMRALVLG